MEADLDRVLVGSCRVLDARRRPVQLLQRRLRLRDGVQWRRNGAFAGTAPALMAQLPLGVLLLDARCPTLKHLKQVDGRRSGMTGPRKPSTANAAAGGMVDVSVGQQNEVDAACVRRN